MSNLLKVAHNRGVVDAIHYFGLEKLAAPKLLDSGLKLDPDMQAAMSSLPEQRATASRPSESFSITNLDDAKIDALGSKIPTPSSRSSADDVDGLLAGLPKRTSPSRGPSNTRSSIDSEIDSILEPRPRASGKRKPVSGGGASKATAPQNGEYPLVPPGKSGGGGRRRNAPRPGFAPAPDGGSGSIPLSLTPRPGSGAVPGGAGAGGSLPWNGSISYAPGALDGGGQASPPSVSGNGYSVDPSRLNDYINDTSIPAAGPGRSRSAREQDELDRQEGASINWWTGMSDAQKAELLDQRKSRDESAAERGRAEAERGEARSARESQRASNASMLALQNALLGEQGRQGRRTDSMYNAKKVDDAMRARFSGPNSRIYMDPRNGLPNQKGVRPAPGFNPVKEDPENSSILQGMADYVVGKGWM